MQKPSEGSPWVSLWEEMKEQASVLGSRFAGERASSCRKLQEDIASLVEWMESREAKAKVAEAEKQWQGMVSHSDEADALAGKLLSYYQDLWKTVQSGGNSTDGAYRCIDYMREFPQMISSDIDEAFSRCLHVEAYF